MRFDAIVDKVSEDMGMPKGEVALYLKAYIEAQRRSVSVFEPTKVHGILSFNLHNYILKYKKEGKRLPMPEGIMEQLNTDRSAYNHRRRAGTFMKVGNTIGVIVRQIGDEDVEYRVLCLLEPYLFGKYERYRLTFQEGGSKVLRKGEYPRTGSVKTFWNKMSYKIDPPMTTNTLIKRLRDAWRG